MTRWKKARCLTAFYTGAETRNPGYSPQCLPSYAGYGLTRWLSHMAPGKNGGAWIDPLDCEENIGYFLQQAFLPILAGARELTLFCAGWLYQTPFIPALGYALQHGPAAALSCQKEARFPGAIAAYEPPRSAPGEEHLSDILGMVGLPLARTPFFPQTGGCVLLTRGGRRATPLGPRKYGITCKKAVRVCLTSGLLEATDENKWSDLTTARVMPGRVTADRYTLWGGSHQVDHRFIQGGEVTVTGVIPLQRPPRGVWPPSPGGTPTYRCCCKTRMHRVRCWCWRCPIARRIYTGCPAPCSRRCANH